MNPNDTHNNRLSSALARLALVLCKLTDDELEGQIVQLEERAALLDPDGRPPEVLPDVSAPELARQDGDQVVVTIGSVTMVLRKPQPAQERRARAFWAARADRWRTFLLEQEARLDAFARSSPPVELACGAQRWIVTDEGAPIGQGATIEEAHAMAVARVLASYNDPQRAADAHGEPCEAVLPSCAGFCYLRLCGDPKVASLLARNLTGETDSREAL